MNYKETINKVFMSIILTVFVYSFYHIEFIRENVEDFSFDLVNKFVLSSQEEKLNAPNLLLFKIDDNYLKEKKLLDENGETTYGYLFPRTYLAQIISRFDELMNDIDEENYPKALFIDYEMSYTSDPHNIVFAKDDLQFIEVLKKDRPFKIYLPKTANHNFIESLDDEIIQNKIKNKELVFVSVGLTISNDDVSRRYYPFEEYLSNTGEKVRYPLVDIVLFKEYKGIQNDISKNFSQDKIAFIENRIIFKNYEDKEIVENSEFIQSKWKNLKVFSANYPLDYIVEEDYKNAILYLGGTHSNSNDVFKKDTFDKELSGIEMHANALMTMLYFDGKLNRFPLIYALLIIASVVLLSDLFFKWMVLIIKKEKEPTSEHFKEYDNKKGLSKLVVLLRDDAYIFLVMAILFTISYYILVEYKQWFNWFIPSLMASLIPTLTSTYSFLKKRNIISGIKSLLWVCLFKYLVKIKKGEKK